MRPLVLIGCLLGMLSCAVPRIQESEPVPAQELRGGVQELRSAFNQHADHPRLVVLAPPSCQRTLVAMGEMRAEIDRLSAANPVTWLVVWQDDLPADDARAAARASTQLEWNRTLFFHDGYGIASRKLARGTVLTGALGRAFLYYPAGQIWSDQPPEPAAWVHCMGRLTPENAERPEGMAQAMANRWVELGE